jgi:hypothetical protein
VELATGRANYNTPSTKELAVATSEGELFIVLVSTGGGKTLILVGNTSLFIAKLDADLILALATTMVSEGVDPSTSAPFTIVSKLYKVFLFTPSSEGSVLLLVLLYMRDIGGRDTAVFEVVADAYSARRSATLCLSGFAAFRLGRSLLVVVEYLPLWSCSLTCCDKPYSLPSVPVGGCLVGILAN